VILLSVIFMLALMAVTAIALNRTTAMHNRIAAYRADAMQIRLGQQAQVEEGLWELTRDITWRTVAEGESEVYQGDTFVRKVLSSGLSGYEDAVVVSVQVPDSVQPMTAAVRYHLMAAFDGESLTNKVYHVARDNMDNLYFAVPDDHTVYRRDAYTGEITRAAGTGNSGYSGDGGPADQAKLNKPFGVHVDGSGNLFIADRDNHCIRKVDAQTGTISTIAGTGNSGDSGDGGPASDAKLDKPCGVFADASGNVYISDTNNDRVRMVDTAGTITAFAGTGSGGYSGDGGPAVNAKLKKPSGIYGDSSGIIYIADTDNHVIRSVDGGIIQTVAGSNASGNEGDGEEATEAELNKPKAVVVDGAGNLYIADTDNHRIRKVDATTKKISRFAGTSSGYSGDGGAATSAQLDKPAGICLLSTGEVVVSDSVNAVLRKIDGSGIIHSLFAPGGIALSKPRAVDMDSEENLYVADTDNHRILKIDSKGSVIQFAGTGSSGFSGDGGEALSAELDTPRYLLWDGSGNLFIADSKNHCVRKIDTSGSITTIAGTGGSSGYSGDGGAATSAKLDEPQGLAMDSSGNLYLADTKNHCIRKVDTSGNISTVAGTGGSSGYSGDGGDAASAKMDTPRGVATDADDNLYVADTKNHAIRKMNASNGVITTVAGTGGSSGYSGDGGTATDALLDSPYASFVDANGNLFIADTKNNVVRMVDASDNIIRTLAGTGAGGYDEGGLVAVASRLHKPTDIVMPDLRGGRRIYIMDKDNSRLRMLRWQRVAELY
jgi:sugar lactone lactonase YvrE